MEEKKNKSIHWRKVLIEAGMIVLSVLLALFINEWKRSYDERIETEKIRQNIISEIQHNQTFIKQLIPYHTAVLNKTNDAIISDSLKPTFLGDGYFNIMKVAERGIIQGDFQNIAWVVAKEERISNRIDLKEAQMLFSTYRQQESVTKTIDRIIKILAAREVHREELLTESVITFGIELHELISQEQDLEYKYEEALQVLRKG